jgi:hypothetical protein
MFEYSSMNLLIIVLGYNKHYKSFLFFEVVYWTLLILYTCPLNFPEIDVNPFSVCCFLHFGPIVVQTCDFRFRHCSVWCSMSVKRIKGIMFCKITEPEIASLQFFNNGNGETISCACETDIQTRKQKKTSYGREWVSCMCVRVCVCVCVCVCGCERETELGWLEVRVCI